MWNGSDFSDQTKTATIRIGRFSGAHTFEVIANTFEINSVDGFDLQDLEVWSAEHLEGELRPLAEKLEIKTGQLFGAIRVAVTGRKEAPPLFETMEVLGRDRCLPRLRLSARLLSDG